MFCKKKKKAPRKIYKYEEGIDLSDTPQYGPRTGTEALLVYVELIQTANNVAAVEHATNKKKVTEKNCC